MKKCPFCAESISDNSVKCKFCGESLSNESKKTVQEHLNVTIKDFGCKKQTFKSVLRYTISIIFILAGRITYSSYNGRSPDSSEICGILVLISGAVGLYMATLLP